MKPTKEQIEKLNEQFVGRQVVTAWQYGELRYHRVKLGDGVRGTIIGFDATGPVVEHVIGEGEDARRTRFWPASPSGDWGNGTTWRPI